MVLPELCHPGQNTALVALLSDTRIKNASETQGTKNPNSVIKFLVEERLVGQLVPLFYEKFAELNLLREQSTLISSSFSLSLSLFAFSYFSRGDKSPKD